MEEFFLVALKFPCCHFRWSSLVSRAAAVFVERVDNSLENTAWSG